MNVTEENIEHAAEMAKLSLAEMHQFVHFIREMHGPTHRVYLLCIRKEGVSEWAVMSEQSFRLTHRFPNGEIKDQLAKVERF
jgi:hypothetical protein